MEENLNRHTDIAYVLLLCEHIKVVYRNQRKSDSTILFTSQISVLLRR
jgi:hypothetical protein